MERLETRFRRNPELEPTGKLSILGKASSNAERMEAYIRRRNPRAPEVAELFLRLGEQYGIRGDVAYCQMAYETNGWTTDVAGPFWSRMSLSQGAIEELIETRMQILYLFATELSLPEEAGLAMDKHVAVIERSGWRGRVACWEDLNGKWQGPGNSRYGQDIVSMWRSMLAWRGKGEIVVDHFPEDRVGGGLLEVPLRNRGVGVANGPNVGTEAMKWLQDQRLLPNPAPHPERKVTWAELAELLRQWENLSPAGTMERNPVLAQKEG